MGFFYFCFFPLEIILQLTLIIRYFCVMTPSLYELFLEKTGKNTVIHNCVVPLVVFLTWILGIPTIFSCLLFLQCTFNFKKFFYLLYVMFPPFLFGVYKFAFWSLCLSDQLLCLIWIVGATWRRGSFSIGACLFPLLPFLPINIDDIFILNIMSPLL